jgi:hypothetical protein
MLHKHLKVYVSSVTRVVRCPVLWIKCVVNNVIFLNIYIHIIRDPVNGAISSVGLTCHL